MSAHIEAKKQIVEDIKAKIQASKSVVLVDYKGLTVAEDTEFRNEFRKANVEYKVLKNTLVRRAFNELGVTDFDNDLNGLALCRHYYGRDLIAYVIVAAVLEHSYIYYHIELVAALYICAHGFGNLGLGGASAERKADHGAGHNITAVQK